MNSPIRRVAAGCLLLCIALLVNATYVQAFWADDLNSRSANKRVVLDEYARQRGPILAADDSVIARSVETDDELKYLRKYPEGQMYAPITGYYSSQYGRTATERAQNDILSGDDDSLFVDRLVDLVGGEERKGGGVKTTINPAAQKAAWDGLGDFKGSVVALNPETGAILAMVSKPSYDPSGLASHSIPEQEKAWGQIQKQNDPDDPALNRAIASPYPPGSTFKLVTAAAALESGDFEPDSTVPGPAAYTLPQSGNSLPNYDQQPCGFPDVSIVDALKVSCNTAFAYLGNEVGTEALREQAEKFGFNSQPLVDDKMNAATSVFPTGDIGADYTAYSSIGQYDVRATPLQVAMVSAAIGNGGTVMEPYLVDELLMPDLVSILEGPREPEEQSQAMSSGNAQALTDMMVEVVNEGTGGNAQIDGIEVAGKTGTAQWNKDKPNYAWFTSFAPADDAKVAVAVFVEEAPGLTNDEIAGGELAAPIAKDVMEAVLEQ